jgi:2-oxoglutarate ferredoxin oxidoreductase subunit delta
MAQRDVTQAGEKQRRKRTRRSRRADAVAVDRDLCKACGICIAFCPGAVFETDAEGKPVVARLDDCTVCGFCEQHCPDFAIDVHASPAVASPPGEEAS